MLTHLAIHHPKPEFKENVLASMRRVDAAAAGHEGLIRINGWREIDGDRLVGISMWESMEAFQAAAPPFSPPRRMTRGSCGKTSRSSRCSSSTRFLEY